MLSLVVCGEFAATAATQEKTPQGKSEASHVERFTDFKVKWQRIEQEATARLAANPKDSSRLLERGSARLNLGKFEAAVQDLNEAAGLNAASLEARTQLAYALWMLGRTGEALIACRSALALNPESLAAHAYAGRILLESGGDVAEAESHLKKAVELDPGDSSLRFDLFAAYRQSGDALHANVELRLLRAILPPTDARIPYAEGLLETDHGQITAAIERFRKALGANPKFVPARYDLARALVQADRWQEALDLLGPLVRDFPRSYTAAYLHALALHNLQQTDEAGEEARRAIALEPRSADAYTLLGMVQTARGAAPEALVSFEKAAGLDAKNFDAQFYLGRARYAVRDLVGAREAFLDATKIRPDDPEARFFLATALEGLGDGDGAQAQYQELIRRRTQDPRGYVGLGNFQAKHGQLDQAAANLRRAHEIDPANFEATLALGRTLARLGQLDPALALLREAVGMMPESAEAHYQLGLVLRRSGHNQEAEQEFAAVDRLNREYRNRSGGMDSLPAPPRN